MTAWTSAGSPLYKVTHANDFMGLSALLRNFCAAAACNGEAPKASKDDAQRLIRSRAPARQGMIAVAAIAVVGSPENAKVVSQGRDETLRIPRNKSLKSLWALNRRFRGIVCFQRLDCHFVSPFSRMRRVDEKLLVRDRESPWIGAGNRPTRRRRVFERALLAQGFRAPWCGLGERSRRGKEGNRPVAKTEVAVRRASGVGARVDTDSRPSRNPT